MTESIFDLLHKPAKREQLKPQELTYNDLLQTFINQNYGYYAQSFISKISRQSTLQYPFLLKYNLKKTLRQTVKKLLMTDLQIVFMSHFLELNQWNLDNKVIANYTDQNGFFSDAQDFQNDHSKLKFMLILVGFFVKSYVAEQIEVEAIQKKLASEIQNFSEIYRKWVQSNPKQYFQISPRKLNLIYSQYTKSRKPEQNKKDFNSMVDRILQLSTTYSMMPSTTTNNRKVKRQESEQKKKGKKKVKVNQIQISDKVSWKMNNNSKISNVQSIEDFGFQLPHPVTRRNSSQSQIFKSMLMLKEKQRDQNQNVKNIQNKNESVKQLSCEKPMNKRVTLKNKRSGNDAKEAMNQFFHQKNNPSGVQQPKNEAGVGGVSFLDFNVRSSIIDVLPFNLRPNSNFSGSQWFLNN